MTNECGELVLQKLFLDFVRSADRRIESLLASEFENELYRQFQRGRDTEFDRLLCALGRMAEFCLSSLIRHALDWRQMKIDQAASSSENLKRVEGIEYVFCHLIIESLQQLNVHPIPERDILKLMDIAFLQFKNVISVDDRPSQISELYAEALGVLSEHRHHQVRQRFKCELRKLRLLETSSNQISSVLNGMKFFKVKMYPIEDFTESVHFLKEIGDYLHDAIDARDKELQQNLAIVITEILTPLAATINSEVNVPVLRQFVDSLYPSVLELAKKKRNLTWVAPLVQLLLAVSQKQYFLNHWSIFLDHCLSAIKDNKYSRVCIESVSRLTWVYCVRHRCEANNTTTTRLQLIIKTIFPVGARHVIPRDQPSAYFVRILSFIAEVNLEIAMNTIEELLGPAALKTTNPDRVQINAEKQNIGIRSFVAIANSLQQQEKPPLPSNMSMPSGNTIRGKKTFLHSPLVDEQARHVGLDKYLPNVSRALRHLLLTLDNLVGYSFLQTKNNKVEDASQEKLDLLTLCVSAIPRILPEGFKQYPSRNVIIKIISQLTIHQSKSLQDQSLKSLLNMLTDLPNIREDIMSSYCNFILIDINDSWDSLIEDGANNLQTLIEKWIECNHTDSSSDYSIILDRLDGFCVLLLSSSSIKVREAAVRLLRSIVNLSQKLNCTSPRLYNILNASVVSMKSIIDQYAGAKAEEWRQELNNMIQSVWSSTTQVTPLKKQRNNSLILFFVFMDAFERIRNGPWESMASPMSVSFIGTQRNRAQPSASGYLQQWGNYLLTSLASAPMMTSQDWSSVATGTPDWLDSRNGGQLSATKNPQALFKWVMESLNFTPEPQRRDIITSCLARTSQASVDTFLTELKLSEAAPNIRRRNKRRDQQKYLTARIIAEMCELGKLNNPVKDEVIQYALQCWEYWKSNPEQDIRPEEKDQRKLTFVRLVVALIRNSPEEYRKDLFTSEQRSHLLTLFGTWSLNVDTDVSSQITTLSCMSLIGRCSVLIAGTVKLDSKFSRWLSKLLLLEENDQITLAVQTIPNLSGSVDSLIIEFVTSLIRSNRDQLNIFSIELIQRCYSSNNPTVNSRSFLSLASVIGSEGWQGSELEQIDQVTIPLLVLSLSNLYSDSPNVSKAAQLFAQVLSKYISPSQTIEAVSIDKYPEKLASSLSKFTYPILIEIFSRLQPLPMTNEEHKSSSELDFFYESRLLSLIIPWIKNIKFDDNRFSAESIFIFNNLLYCNYSFSRRHPSVTKQIWASFASNQSNALLTLNLINALCRLDNLDPMILSLLQDVAGEICLKATAAFDYVINNLTNHTIVSHQIQAAADLPHWVVKKTKPDSPNGSVNSGKFDSIISRERRTKTATTMELSKINQSTVLIRDRAMSNRDIYRATEDIEHVKFFYLPFYQLLPDRFHSSKESMGSISILLVPNLLNDRRRHPSSLETIIPQILAASILYLDSSVQEIRESARLSLLALSHGRLVKCEINQGARVLLQQLENRGQLTSTSSYSDSGFNSTSSQSSTVQSPQSFESSSTTSSGTSSLSMVHFLCTTRKFWIKELASPSFMPSSLRSTLQLNNLTNSLIGIFGVEIKPILSDLTINSAFTSPYQPITCRALQLYRSLNLPITDRVILKLTQKLSELVSDPHEERQAAVLEIIDTFVAGIEYFRKEQIPKFKNNEKKSSSCNTNNAQGRMARHTTGHRRTGSMYGSELKMDFGETMQMKHTSTPVFGLNVSLTESDMGNDIQHNIYGNLLRVSVALLHSDYEHEYRAGLKIISRINSITPLKKIVREMMKSNDINPSEGIQNMLWKGLARERDANCDATPLENEVFDVLVATLKSCDEFNRFGLSIQLASLLPRLSTQYLGTSEKHAALQASQAVVHHIKSKNVVGKQFQAGQSLEMIFRLYADGDYKQGETNWLGAVCKYLHEFCPEAMDDQIQFFLNLLDSRDCPIWLCSASAAAIRFLLQHCSAAYYPPPSLRSVVRSLSKIVQHHQKKSPVIIETSLAALQSIVGRASILFSPADSQSRPNSPLSNPLPGRVLEFEVDYDHIEEDRKQIIHWKRTSTGRDVRIKLRNILQIKSSSSSTNGAEAENVREEVIEDKVPDEMKHFDFLYYDSVTTTDERDYLYDIDFETHKFKIESAHDTEKEEKDDFDVRGNIIDLRPGQKVPEEEQLPKKVKKKRRPKKPIDEDSSDASNRSTQRMTNRPSSMPGNPMNNRHSMHSAFSDVTSHAPHSNPGSESYSELELPWSATLPISPALRSQWQKLLDNGDIMSAINVFPTIWNSLRVSTNWIVNKQLPARTKAMSDIKNQFLIIIHMINELSPSQFYSSSQRAISSKNSKKLNLKVLALSESLYQFAQSDNHVRNCIDLITSQDAQKSLEYCRLLYKLFYQLDSVLKYFHQVTDLLKSTNFENTKDVTEDFFDRYYKPLGDLYKNSPQLNEINISDLKVEELVQLAKEKDFVFLKMKIENNGQRKCESPNPNPLYYLLKACFDSMSKNYSEDVIAHVHDEADYQEAISEQLMEINEHISAELRQNDRNHSTSSSSSNSIIESEPNQSENFEARCKKINDSCIFSRSLNASNEPGRKKIARRTSF